MKWRILAIYGLAVFAGVFVGFFAVVYVRHSSFHSDSLSVESHRQDSLKEALSEDLVKCSLAMGMARESIQKHRSAIAEVSQRAMGFLSSVQSIVPSKFSKHHRNPCWYTSDVSLLSKKNILYTQQKSMEALTKVKNYFRLQQSVKKVKLCMPFFFIAGFPKCGTTSLHAAIAHHPDVYAPQTKEPHWWTHHPEPEPTKWLAAYLKVFRTSKGEMKRDAIAYDASQDTLWASKFFTNNSTQDYCAMPAVVKRVLPKAKFIVIMRNPVTRAYSDFLYAYALVHWHQTSPQLPQQFHTRAMQYLSQLNNCSVQSSLYECITREQRIDARTMRRFNNGLYYVHLKKWLQFYDKEQFLFLRTEDMSADPFTLMQQVTSFLGISSLTEVQVKGMFKQRMNVNKPAHATDLAILPETASLLKDFYRSHNEDLADLLDDNRFLWLD